MSNRIEWNETLKRWGLEDRQLIDCMMQGLQPYSKYTGNLYDCPKEFHLGYHAKMRILELNNQIENLSKELKGFSSEISRLKDERSIHEKQLAKYINEDPYCRSWENFTFFRNEKKAKEFIFELRDHVEFKLHDIEEFEKKHGIVRKETASKTEDDVRKHLKADHQKVFLCKPGTRWEDIKIKLINDKRVEIETPQGKDRYSYSDLKMEKKSSPDKPRKIWPMLMLFAISRGCVNKGVDETLRRIFYNEYKININEKLSNYTKQLDKHLKELFGIKDSIFKYHYNKRKAYITKINFIPPSDTDTKVLNDEIALIEDPQTLHETEAKDVQDKLGISDLQCFSDSPLSGE